MANNLITGGIGFLGLFLARRLLQDGEQVVLFDIAQKPGSIGDIEQQVEIIQGDLGNWTHIQDAIKKHSIDCVYHLGAMLLAASEANPQSAYLTNVTGTFNMLEAARQFNIPTVIFASSISVYGNIPGRPAGKETVNEDVITVPTTIYGVTKVFGEQLGTYYNRKYNINFRGVRLPALLGPGRNPKDISSYFSLMVQESVLGHKYRVCVDESTRIPFIYVKDVVESLVTLRRASDVNITRRVYNLEGYDVSAGEEAMLIRKYLPQAQIEFIPDETIIKTLKGSPLMDASKARADWGFKFRFTPEEAIKDLIDILTDRNNDNRR